MPAALRGPFKLTSAQRKTFLSIFLLLLLVAALVFVIQGPLAGWVAAASEVIPISNATGSEQEPYISEAAVVHGQPKPTVTLQELIATATKAVTPTFALPKSTDAVDASDAVSYGDHGAYLIHKVAKGESLSSLAERYGSSPEAITAVNHFLPAPLWEGWLMVVPSGITDPIGLPAFEVYLAAADTSVTDLSNKLEVDPQALTKYNGLEVSGEVPSGTWLLILKSEEGAK